MRDEGKIEGGKGGGGGRRYRGEGRRKADKQTETDRGMEER